MHQLLQKALQGSTVYIRAADNQTIGIEVYNKETSESVHQQLSKLFENVVTIFGEIVGTRGHKGLIVAYDDVGMFFLIEQSQYVFANFAATWEECCIRLANNDIPSVWN